MTTRSAAPVHAAILAAGLSTRLGGIQKALHPIAGVSLLERSIRQLMSAGLATITVICGHRADDVEEAIRQLAITRVETLDNDSYEAWNNFYSVELACERAPAGALLIVNGDVIYTPRALAAVLEPATGDLFLGVVDDEVDEEAMKVATTDSRVIGLGKSIPPSRSNGEFIGISRLMPAARRWYVSFSRWSRARGLTSLYYEDVYDALCGGLFAVRCTVGGGEWAEVDAPSDLTNAQAVAERPS
jgi:choline kinase